MPCPGIGPCEVWDLDLSCCLALSGNLPDPCILNGEPVPPEFIESSKLAASQFMWAKTGQQFGCCTVTLNLCKQCPGACDSDCCIPGFEGAWFDVGYGFGYPWYPAHLADGSWTNVSCPSCDSCACDRCRIPLPYPTCSVEEVIIGGEVIDPNDYVVLDFKELAFAPAASGTCNIGCGDKVTVTYGRPVPELVRRAAAELACEFIKNCVGQPCRLPQRISSVSRQGVSVSFLDPMEFMSDGLTGVYLVDLAIRTYNPKGLVRRPYVYSPDSANKWKVETWKPGDPIGPGCT